MRLQSLPGFLLDRLPGFCVDVPVDDWELITQPKDYDFLYNRVNRRYKELRKITDQDLWKNYRGIKAGPAKDRFKTKTFF